MKNILITDIEDVAYLTGFRGFKIPYSSSLRLKMLIKDDKVEFFNSDLPLIKEETAVFQDSLSLDDFLHLKNPKILKINYAGRMASIKTKSELDAFRKVFETTDRALFNFKKQIRAGLSETELKNILEKEFFKLNAAALSFKTILAIGENSASIHYSTYDENKILKKNDIVLVDCGIYLKDGLASDITRVFAVGKPSELQKKIYTLVLKAFLNAYCKHTETGTELDFKARRILNSAPKGFDFPHALGHGIGLNVHAYPPLIAPVYNKKIKKNMVFSIEPGLYKKGEFGIRLENAVYIGENGEKISLSKFPFEKALINFDMLNKKEAKWLSKWSLE